MDIKTMAELIKKYPSPISELTRLAQAVHETGNFKSDIFKNANNSFGIKASAPWAGETYSAKTGEHFGGKDVIVRDNFRKYKTVEDSVADQALFFVSTNHRKNVAYKEAIEAPNYIEEGKALMGPGKYATDVPSANSIGYAAKLLRTIENYGLKNYGMKESASLKDIEVAKETPKEENKGEDIKMAYIGLDIGHGANTWETGGGKGVSTGGRVYEEHTFNSIVAKKLKTLLEKSGHKVTYGVQQPMANDTSLASRTNRFKAEKVDVLISIHANWIGTFKNSTNGIGAFYASYYAGTRTNNSKKLADAIMAQYRKQGQTIYGAGSIPSVLTNWTNFHMTREVTMPAVLMELGFMSGTTDFDKIFGSQQDKYTTQMAEGMANGINAYFGMASVPAGGTSSTPATGGADEVKWATYKAPTQPFAPLKTGQTVRIRKGQSAWYMPGTPTVGKKPSKDFAGDVDTISKVMDVNVSYSKKAYLLKNKVSWILEQDLEEPRAGWTSNTSQIKTHTVAKGEYLYLIGEQHGVTVANIKDWNSLSSNVLFTGQKLYVEDPAKKSQEPTKPLPPTDVVEVPKEEQPKDEGAQTPAIELKDGEFMWEGVKYKIVKGII